MSSAPPPGNPPSNPEKQPEQPLSSDATTNQDAAAMDTTPDSQPEEETWADIPEEVMALSTDEILTRIRLIENDIKVGEILPIYVIYLPTACKGDAFGNVEIAA